MGGLVSYRILKETKQRGRKANVRVRVLVTRSIYLKVAALSCRTSDGHGTGR